MGRFGSSNKCPPPWPLLLDPTGLLVIRSPKDDDDDESEQCDNAPDPESDSLWPSAVGEKEELG